MARPLLPDELWEVIEPLLPAWTPSPLGGQPRLEDRKALTGILFVLKTGLPWGEPALRDGLRLRHDVLATPAGLAAGRHLGPDPARVAG